MVALSLTDISARFTNVCHILYLQFPNQLPTGRVRQLSMENLRI